MRRVAIVLGCTMIALTCVAYHAATTPDVPMFERGPNGLALSRTVVHQFASMMARGVHDQVEPAACVSSYRLWTDSATHRRLVNVYALTVAETDSADSLNIWWHRSICGDTQPSVHGHIWRQMVVDEPSPRDSLTAANISRAPFQILLFRVEDDSTFGVRLYGVRP